MDRSIVRFAWAALAAAVLLLGVAGWSARRTAAFLDRASAARGEVVALERRSSKAFPVVRFEASGEVHTLRGRVGSRPPAYEVGEAVEVVYDPGDPAGGRIRSFGELWALAAIIGGVGLALGAAGGALLGVRVAAARRRDALRLSGLRVEARIRAVEENTRIGNAGKHPWRIVCEWQDPATGRVHVFRSPNLWVDPAPPLRGREHVTVLVDRKDPARHWMDLGFLPNVVG